MILLYLSRVERAAILRLVLGLLHILTSAFMASPNRSVSKEKTLTGRRSPSFSARSFSAHEFPNKCVFSFTEGNKNMRTLLGGKGANLAEMTGLGLPVPPGFTITTEVCNYFLTHGDYPAGYSDQLDERLAELETMMGKKFGDAANPLLVSVRSGAAVSMPGMMDTILNLGLNDETVLGLAKRTSNERFAYDSYRRFINMFGDVVLGVDHEHFEAVLDEIKNARGATLDTELTAADLCEVVAHYKEVVRLHAGCDFPTDPREQLRLAIDAVFRSWMTDRAVVYRRINHIPSSIVGTAVNVQSMVFGNMGERSGTGVAFTRNPATGEAMFYGEFLINAQGEDVVAGIRTPQPIAELERVMPMVYAQLLTAKNRLEQHYRDMQDIEFTVEDGTLYMLQTRNGKRTGQAAVKIAVDLVREGLLTKEEALLKIDPHSLNQLLHPRLDPRAPRTVIARGLPASPGGACGRVVFSADEAVLWVNRGEKVILVKRETTPEDIHGMYVAQGILTAQGGMTSHAAVVCRGMGKCCVAGCAAITVDKDKKIFRAGDLTICEGDTITLDGSAGEVISGSIPTIEPAITGDFEEIMSWTDAIRTLHVRTNADTPRDVAKARSFGAEGIGLCRTEHMFFDDDRIPAVREMIVSKTLEARQKALAKLLPFQREDFLAILRVMDGYPVTIRLLDPPLHEFLPHKDEQIASLAQTMHISADELKQIVQSLQEVNPMLGHRGCRLAITFPEIYEMQVRAIIEAAIAAHSEGIVVIPEIEIPLVAHVQEMIAMRALVERVIAEYADTIAFPYKIGTMIELPRACLTANELAPHVDFFSFGTNDLTQTTYGISRDDVGKFMNDYIEKGIFERDPSESIDVAGVGELMKMAVTRGRGVKPDLEVGICGEHGGDPASVEFCHAIGLNYVSCSPFRVPIARLAAAQAALKNL